MLGKPYAIAQIDPSSKPRKPAPLAGEVHTLTTSRKRKEPELALAIDGQSINVYDVSCLVELPARSTLMSVVSQIAAGHILCRFARDHLHVLPMFVHIAQQGRGDFA